MSKSTDNSQGNQHISSDNAQLPWFYQSEDPGKVLVFTSNANELFQGYGGQTLLYPFQGQTITLEGSHLISTPSFSGAESAQPAQNQPYATTHYGGSFGSSLDSKRQFADANAQTQASHGNMFNDGTPQGGHGTETNAAYFQDSQGYLLAAGNPHASIGNMTAAGNPHASIGNMTAAGNPHASIGNMTAAGNPHASIGNMTAAGNPHASIGNMIAAGNPHASIGNMIAAGNPHASIGNMTAAGSSQALGAIMVNEDNRSTIQGATADYPHVHHNNGANDGKSQINHESMASAGNFHAPHGPGVTASYSHAPQRNAVNVDKFSLFQGDGNNSSNLHVFHGNSLNAGTTQGLYGDAVYCPQVPLDNAISAGNSQAVRVNNGNNAELQTPRENATIAYNLQGFQGSAANAGNPLAQYRNTGNHQALHEESINADNPHVRPGEVDHAVSLQPSRGNGVGPPQPISVCSTPGAYFKDASIADSPTAQNEACADNTQTYFRDETGADSPDNQRKDTLDADQRRKHDCGARNEARAHSPINTERREAFDQSSPSQGGCESRNGSSRSYSRYKDRAENPHRYRDPYAQDESPQTPLDYYGNGAHAKTPRRYRFPSSPARAIFLSPSEEDETYRFSKTLSNRSHGYGKRSDGYRCFGRDTTWISPTTPRSAPETRGYRPLHGSGASIDFSPVVAPLLSSL